MTRVDPLGLITPAGATRPADGRAAPGVGFGDMLRRARSGEIRTDRPVSVSPTAGVELPDDVLSRLGAALDRAESAGAITALLIDGDTAYIADVQTRTITGRADLASGSALTGIDAVVRAEPPGIGASSTPPLPVGPAGNRSLAELLAGRDRAA